MAAIPLAKTLLQRQPKLSGGFEPPDNYLSGLGKGAFVPETTGTAYLLVELLDEKGDFIREVNKYYVTSQGEFIKIGSADNDPIDRLFRIIKKFPLYLCC